MYVVQVKDKRVIDYISVALQMKLKPMQNAFAAAKVIILKNNLKNLWIPTTQLSNHTLCAQKKKELISRNINGAIMTEGSNCFITQSS